MLCKLGISHANRLYHSFYSEEIGIGDNLLSISNLLFIQLLQRCKWNVNCNVCTRTFITNSRYWCSSGTTLVSNTRAARSLFFQPNKNWKPSYGTRTRTPRMTLFRFRKLVETRYKANIWWQMIKVKFRIRVNVMSIVGYGQRTVKCFLYRIHLQENGSFGKRLL